MILPPPVYSSSAVMVHAVWLMRDGIMVTTDGAVGENEREGEGGGGGGGVKSSYIYTHTRAYCQVQFQIMQHLMCVFHYYSH